MRISVSWLNDLTCPRSSELFIVLVIVLVALISFGLGRLSKIRENRAPITIENVGASVGRLKEAGFPPQAQLETRLQNGTLVASKNGTKYHYPWCSGAQRIKESNKVWFESREEAEKAGYTPAANCKGLK